MTDHHEDQNLQGLALLTADPVMFAYEADVLVLLVKRARTPFPGSWALPGGAVAHTETASEAAARLLAEGCGLDLAPAELHPFGFYVAPGRDPRWPRRVSAACVGAMGEPADLHAGPAATDTAWFPVAEALAMRLAFDHHQVITDAVGFLDRLLPHLRDEPCL